MKPYGKSTTFVFNCRCCSINISPRQEAKRELAKLIQEERYPENKCPVCGQIDDPDCVENC